MNYSQAFNKLTEAYIKDEVNPFSSCNCFVGNLLDNSNKWAHNREYQEVINKKFKITSCVTENKTFDNYTMQEIVKLERMFLITYIKFGKREEFCENEDEFNYGKETDFFSKDETWENVSKIQEDALFKAFEKTLDLLKDIHKNKGEDIDNQFIPEFKKRELQTA